MEDLKNNKNQNINFEAEPVVIVPVKVWETLRSEYRANRKAAKILAALKDIAGMSSSLNKIINDVIDENREV